MCEGQCLLTSRTSTGETDWHVRSLIRIALIERKDGAMKSILLLIRNGSVAAIVVVELCSTGVAKADSGSSVGTGGGTQATGTGPAGAFPNPAPPGSPPYGTGSATQPPGTQPGPAPYGTAPNGYRPYGTGPYSNSVQPGVTNDSMRPGDTFTNSPNNLVFPTNGTGAQSYPDYFVPAGNGFYQLGTNTGFRRGTNGFFRHDYQTMPDEFIPDRGDFYYDDVDGVYRPIDVQDKARGIYRNGVLYSPNSPTNQTLPQ